ncbi:MAG TPA: hypothetical protein PKA05_23945, partial [Roseiflexaceae bacterium]|nr:hypothetical protein [Roseiflexaceae bacterium]
LPEHPPETALGALLYTGNTPRTTLAVYWGDGQMLTIRTRLRLGAAEALPGRADVRETLADETTIATLAFLGGGRAEALLLPQRGGDGRVYITRVVGQGFDRETFRDLVRSLRPITSEIAREQSALFRQPVAMRGDDHTTTGP